MVVMGWLVVLVARGGEKDWVQRVVSREAAGGGEVISKG